MKCCLDACIKTILRDRNISKFWNFKLWLLKCKLDKFMMYKKIHQNENAVKPVLRSHSKIDKTKVLKTSGSSMKVESNSECSIGAFAILLTSLSDNQSWKWSILQYVWPSLSNNRSWKPSFGLLFEWPLKTGFTVVNSESLQIIWTEKGNLSLITYMYIRMIFNLIAMIKKRICID